MRVPTLKKKEFVKVPTVVVNGEKWGDLSAFGGTHEICGTQVNSRKDISFKDGHRVRLYQFKKMVHWRIPKGTELDISDVEPDRRRALAAR